MELMEAFEVVIGLEVHVQLSTNSKLFCGDGSTFRFEPNSQLSNISLAHPGSLPRTNRTAAEYAVKMGIACNCEIERQNYFARKNYCYPDLPKGYQISQHTSPICKRGNILISVGSEQKNIQLNRIHLEEDAGKSIHDADDRLTCIDHNRAGTALIEIVTEPCIHSAEEAAEYVSSIRKLVRWLEISDGNMERGNLRCDVNISIRRSGETSLGTKVEVKNLNSIRNVRKAIEFEAERMAVLLQQGGAIVQQTRSFDASTDTTFPLRDKEEVNDYRYFPDPDLSPFVLTEQYIQRLKNQMPELPATMLARLQDQFGLSSYDSLQLTDDRSVTNLFLDLASCVPHYKAIANWINGPIRKMLNETGYRLEELNLNTQDLARLISFVEDGKVSFTNAASKVFPAMIASGKGSAELIEQLELQLIDNTSELLMWIDAAINKMPEKVAEYKKGKKGVIGLFVGEVKRLSKGKADPKQVNELLEQRLNK